MATRCTEQQFRIESSLRASAETVWNVVTSVAGIRHEMAPIMRMTTPRGVAQLSVETVPVGERMFRSWILLFGVLPFDYSDLTLVELVPGVRFVEESPMGTMRRWRHERSVQDHPDNAGWSCLVDDLTWTSRVAPRVASWAVPWFFRHRHTVLRQQFGQAGVSSQMGVA